VPEKSDRYGAGRKISPRPCFSAMMFSFRTIFLVKI
jgi:hypothetical protein